MIEVLRHKLTLWLLSMAARTTVWGDSWDYIMDAYACESSKAEPKRGRRGGA